MGELKPLQTLKPITINIRVGFKRARISPLVKDVMLTKMDLSRLLCKEKVQVIPLKMMKSKFMDFKTLNNLITFKWEKYWLRAYLAHKETMSINI